MEEERGPVAQLLRPILDTYMDGAVALIGCHTLGIERESCEYDVAVVTNDSHPKNSVRVGGLYFDLFFMTEKEALKPSDPEVAVSMASAKTVRDNSLVISTGSAAALAVLSESAARCAGNRLAACVKAMGRADEALSKSAPQDADFWLLSAAYDFAFAWLYSLEVRPAPSHLLEQLRSHSKGSSRRYEAFSRAAGLERASRTECELRLDSVSVLFDVLDAPHAEPEVAKPSSTRVTYQIVKQKSDQLGRTIQHADCYSFLGYQVADTVQALSRFRASEGIGSEQSLLVSSLSKGQERLISETVVQGLGLRRQERTLREGLSALREQVSSLAKKT